MTKLISNDEYQRCFYCTDPYWDLTYRVGRHMATPKSRQKVIKTAVDEYFFSRGIVNKDGREIPGWEDRIGPIKKLEANVKRRKDSSL
jgi:hypothetical protein